MTTYGTFTRDGATRTAYTPAEAVGYRFDGWEQTGGAQAADVPPRAGSGSGRDAWAAYATGRGVVPDESATREQIIADLDQHGVPTERDTDQ